MKKLFAVMTLSLFLVPSALAATGEKTALSQYDSRALACARADANKTAKNATQPRAEASTVRGTRGK